MALKAIARISMALTIPALIWVHQSIEVGNTTTAAHTAAIAGLQQETGLIFDLVTKAELSTLPQRLGRLESQDDQQNLRLGHIQTQQDQDVATLAKIQTQMGETSASLSNVVKDLSRIKCVPALKLDCDKTP